MKQIKILILFFTFFLINFSLFAQCTHGDDHQCIDEKSSCCSTNSWDGNRPDSKAPIGVMADHYHHKGGLMFSYRFMNMNMGGNLRGTDKTSNNAIYQYYMMAPKNMNMQMHMIGAMYGIHDKITLAVMANYLRNEMNARMMGGENHFHESNGFGDIKFNAIAGLWKAKKQSFHINAGLSIPTGGIAESADFPMEHMGMEMSKYPYRMQLGSGTWDVLLGATYLVQRKRFSFGAQISSVIRTTENSSDYRFGDVYQLTSWGAFKATNWLSFSLRAEGSVEEEMKGSDADLERMLTPSNDAKNFGGEIVKTFGGFNIMIPSGTFSGLNFGFEYGFPVYQNVNGIQMNHDETLTLGIKYSLF